MRVRGKARLGLADVDLAQQRAGTRAPSRRTRAVTGVAVQLDRLVKLVADGVARVEARVRILKDHRDVASRDPPPLVLPQLHQVAPGELHSRSAHPTGRVD